MCVIDRRMDRISTAKTASRHAVKTDELNHSLCVCLCYYDNASTESSMACLKAINLQHVVDSISLVGTVDADQSTSMSTTLA